MMKGFLKDNTPGMQFLFTLLVVVASWLIFQLIALAGGVLIYDIPFKEIPGIVLNPSTPREIAFLKFLQTIISLGLFAVSSAIAAYFISERPAAFLGLSHAPDAGIFLLVGLLVLLSLPLNNYLTFLNSRLSFHGGMQWLQDYIVDKESSINDLMERFLSVNGIGPLMINLVVIAVVPAISEELLFRGVLQKLFVKWVNNVHFGIFITALVFGFFHFQFLSFLPRFYLGIIFGYLLVWTGSLWITMFAHFINNATAVLFYYFYYQGVTDDSIDQVGTPGSHFAYALLSLAVVAVLLMVVRRIMKEKQAFSQY